MKKEAVDEMKLVSGNIYIDATLGGGGYTEKIIEELNKQGESSDPSILISFDLDIEAIENFKEILTGGEVTTYQELQLEIKKVKYLKIYIGNVKLFLINANFAEIKEILNELRKIHSELFGLKEISSVVADLGLNSKQLDEKSGFSFKNLDQELDMRLDMNSEVPAWKLVQVLGENQLAMIFRTYGDERHANKLARDIKRMSTDIKTVGDLVSAINRSVGRDYAVSNDVHSRVFQALRIAVNTEYQNLEIFLQNSYDLLNNNGRLVIITFHSGEDRIVKHFQKKMNNENKFKIPSETEITSNNRSRSAKLRIIQKL